MKNNSNLPYYLFAAFLLGMILGKYCFGTSKDKVEFSLFNGKPSKLQSVINIVDTRYVDIINIDSLTELVIPEVLSHLDPHTSYISAGNRNEVEKNLNGKFCGVGIEYNVFNDTIEILYTSPDGPARKAGLRPGDQLIYVDTIYAVAPYKRNPAIKAISGNLGSTVDLKVKRYGCDSLIPIRLERGYVTVNNVTTAYMVDTATGYIKIESFGNNSYNEFMYQLKKLEQQKARNLIIDLRDNGGGRVDQAKQIVSTLLPPGDTIAYTTNRSNNIEEVMTDTTQMALCQRMKIVCLVNSKTASASEIMTGAIQDNDRGIILGRRTYGKGLVQTPIQLNDGSLIRLTTERYYTPSGRSLQKSYLNHKNELAIRVIRGEMDSAGAYHPADTTRYYTRNGRTVYSKGGIMPDIFVAENHKYKKGIFYSMDSASIYHRYAAMRHSIIPGTDSTANADYIGQLTQNPDATLDDMIEFANSNGLNISKKKDKKFLQENGEKMLAYMLAYAYHIADSDDDYYRLNNYGDTDIETALQTIYEDDSFAQLLNINE